MKQVPAVIRHCVVTSGETIEHTEEDKLYITALRYELAQGLGVILGDEAIRQLDKKIVTEIYEDVVFPYIKSKQLCQPFFPNLIPVKDFIDIDSALKNICYKTYGAVKGIIYPVTEQQLESLIMVDPKRASIDFDWLKEKYKDSPLSYIMYKAYSDNMIGERHTIPLKRKARQEIMSELENISSHNKDDIQKEDWTYWYRLILLLHPEEYKKSYPVSSSFLLDLKEDLKSKLVKSKILPPPQRLKNILGKAWRSNKEFEAFENYLQETNNPWLLLKDYHDLEIRPALSKYKWNYEIMIGKFRGDQGEEVIAETMMTLIKDKILDLLQNKGEGRKYWPEDWKNIPATFILSKLGWWELDFTNYEKVRISVLSSLFIYKIAETGEFGSGNKLMWKPKEFKPTKSLIFIRPLQSRPKRLKSEPLSKNGGIVIVEVDGKEEATFDLSCYDTSGILAFILDGNRKKLRWIGESSKIYYQGWPDEIKNSRDIIRSIELRWNPEFSLYELCKALYGEPDINGDHLVLNEILCQYQKGLLKVNQ